MFCPSAPSSTPRGIASRVQPEVGRAIDVSALTGRELNALFGELQEWAPGIVDEARSECPNEPYAICERALQLFEAREGQPFRIDGGRAMKRRTGKRAAIVAIVDQLADDRLPVLERIARALAPTPTPTPTPELETNTVDLNDLRLRHGGSR